jgi:hypothetical protein
VLRDAAPEESREEFHGPGDCCQQRQWQEIPIKRDWIHHLIESFYLAQKSEWNENEAED